MKDGYGAWRGVDRPRVIAGKKDNRFQVYGLPKVSPTFSNRPEAEKWMREEIARLPKSQRPVDRPCMCCGATFESQHIGTRLNRSTVNRYLKGLTEAGYLQHVPAPTGCPASWKLVRDNGYHAPRVRADGTRVTLGDVTSQLWTAMNGLKDFDFRDLVQNASITIPEATAKDYCKRLLAAGYLRVLQKADPALARIARYRLIRPSGPRAPQVQRVRQVYDPNTDTAYPVEGAL